jgi:SAM-dependent methyltransferase
VEEDSVRSRWSDGRSVEVAFWDNWLRTHGREWSEEEFAYRIDPDTEINIGPIVNFLKQNLAEDISILDVGAGPVTSLGKNFPGKRIHITATDPLADEYNRLLELSELVAPVRTLQCEGEHLLDLFAPGTFDIAYSHNALDHCYNPLHVIQNMIALVKSDGLVFLQHAKNEAIRQQGFGMHLWNFDIRGGSLVLWNESQLVDVTSYVQDEAQVVCYTEGDPTVAEPWIAAEITKRPTAKR